MCSLAASDLLIGVCVLADCSLYYFNMCAFHYEECGITTCVQVIAVLASNINLLQVRTERTVFEAITYMYKLMGEHHPPVEFHV